MQGESIPNLPRCDELRLQRAEQTPSVCRIRMALQFVKSHHKCRVSVILPTGDVLGQNLKSVYDFQGKQKQSLNRSVKNANDLRADV